MFPTSVALQNFVPPQGLGPSTHIGDLVQGLCVLICTFIIFRAIFSTCYWRLAESSCYSQDGTTMICLLKTSESRSKCKRGCQIALWIAPLDFQQSTQMPQPHNTTNYNQTDAAMRQASSTQIPWTTATPIQTHSDAEQDVHTRNSKEETINKIN